MEVIMDYLLDFIAGFFIGYVAYRLSNFVDIITGYYYKDIEK